MPCTCIALNLQSYSTSLAAPLPAQALPANLSGPPLAHTHTGGGIEPNLEAHRAPRPLFGSYLPLFLVLAEPLVQTAPIRPAFSFQATLSD